MSKAEPTKAGRLRGYVAMLVVDPDFRKGGIGMRLAAHAISKMRERCDEVRPPRGRIPALAVINAWLVCASRKYVSPLSLPLCDCLQIVLETEATNASALRLYESLGFLRDKRLPRYYLNGNDAYRLKLWVR